ncbi:MAG: hydantoinase/oxoprolinase family protein [Acidimicrobiales bacterium]
MRIGVDVGGTFTKAVAYDLDTRAVVAQAVLPTTHTHVEGVAHGVVEAVHEVAQVVGPERVDLVVHSTTQAVNALLEGDVGQVGIIGLGRRPEIGKVRKRTALDHVELSPGKELDTRPAMFDVTDGLPLDEIRATLEGWKAEGMSAVCVAEAFAPDDSTAETTVAALAAQIGLPACASSELTGLYGLELRTVTAAINASIIPIALRTASYVEQGVAAAGITSPVLVMRGDGGATDLDGFRSAPARTLYSGPAASVAGALRVGDVGEGVVIEVGGTSTNIAAIHQGHPRLSYVQVASHSTALRAVDVRVIGVAGGSMLRVRRRRFGGLGVYGVGPRSAHIAGLGYACFEPVDAIVGATAVEFSPRAGDPADYLALDLTDGRRLALTNTCAANALGVTEPDDYAYADGAAARAAFAVAGQVLGLDGDEVARRMLEASGTAVCELVAAVAESAGLVHPPLVAVGGGAGGLGRHVAAMLRYECRVPDGAEVISSLGDALSLVRAERERTVDATGASVVNQLMDEVEAELLGAGAAASTIDIRVEERPEKGTVRAVATGAIGLTTGALPGRAPIDADEAARIVADLGLGSGAGAVHPIGAYWLAGGGEHPGRVVVLDRFGDVLVDVVGDVDRTGDATVIGAAVERLTRHRGPVTLLPSVWVIHRSRFTELSSGDRAAAAAQLVAGSTEPFAAIVGQS